MTSTDCLPIIREFRRLKLTKRNGKKFVCYPVIPGRPGPEGPTGTILINDTSFVDLEFGTQEPPAPEDITRPYPSVQAAIADIPGGATSWQIFVWPGNYPSGGTISPALATNSPNVQLDIRGSGPASTIINDPIENQSTESNLMTLANFTQTVGTMPNLRVGSQGQIRARDLEINNTDLGTPVFINDSETTGLISVSDSRITSFSASSEILANILGGSFSLIKNQISINHGVGSIINYIPSTPGQVTVSDNTIDYTFGGGNDILYNMVGGSAPGRMLVNDNFHTVTRGAGSLTASTIYNLQGGSQSLLLGRNNEYIFQGFTPEEEGSIILASAAQPLIKIVDDTTNLEPMPRIVPPASADPGGPIQYQSNSGNALATNQGIQLANREIEGDHTTNDNDYFIHAIGSGAITVTLQEPDASIRGKLIVIRNDTTDMSDVTVVGENASFPTGPLTISPGQVVQFINDGVNWYVISIS